MKLRRNSLDCFIGCGRNVVDVVMAPLKERGIVPLVVDVGARNGMQLLPSSYCRHSSLLGFEPNPAEYEKLVHRNTDAHRIGANIPEFFGEEYQPYALWSESGRHKFFVTKGPGAATLMGHAVSQVVDRMYLDYRDDRRTKSFDELHSEVLEEIEVPCTTLDESLDDGVICDFLKLDVEGAELRCLKGAHNLLSQHRALFIYCEFVAFPYYNEHCVLGDLHSLLNNYGYRLLDIETGHSTYRRDQADFPENADRRLLHAGDAVFCLDFDRVNMSPIDRQRLAIVLLAFGFNSLGLSLFREAKLNTSSDIEQIYQVLARNYTIRRVKKIWEGFPTRLANFVRRIFR